MDENTIMPTPAAGDSAEESIGEEVKEAEGAEDTVSAE